MKNKFFLKTSDPDTIEKLIGQGVTKLMSIYGEDVFLIDGKINFDKDMKYVLTDKLPL